MLDQNCYGDAKLTTSQESKKNTKYKTNNKNTEESLFSVIEFRKERGKETDRERRYTSRHLFNPLQYLTCKKTLLVASLVLPEMANREGLGRGLVV